MDRQSQARPSDVRAQQVWTILIGAASNRQTMTYLELAIRMGFKENVPARVTAPYMDAVARYCQQAGLPPLTVLVVGQNTGIPGDGLLPFIPEDSTYDAEREKVYQCQWHQMVVPSPDEFRGVWQ